MSLTKLKFSTFSHPKGVPFRIWQQAIKRRYSLLVFPAIMRETARVLREYLDWTEAAIVAQLKLVAKVGQIVTPTITLKVIVEDDSDNRILECAVAGKADLIVSGDNPPEKAENLSGHRHCTAQRIFFERWECKRFLADRRSRPSVIIMSIKDYIKNSAPTPVAYQAIRQDAKNKGTASLSMREIDREIAAVRKLAAQKKKSKSSVK